MKKDLQSYALHDSEYKSNDINSVEKNRKMLDEYRNEKLFERLGFGIAISLTSKLPKMHVDIGSGTGWLVNEMSNFFEQSTGVEPSKMAVEIARELFEKKTNVTFINMEMVEFMHEMQKKEPVFITTSTVLNHIEDYHVEEFLGIINNLPTGSVLYFSERYDKNTNWNMWHVRNKEWWSHNLPCWQLVFLNLENSGYSDGIYGIRVGLENVIKTKGPSLGAKILWHTSYVTNIFVRIVKKFLRPYKK